ncbi:MAG TPA: alpha/beta hydrolase [Ruminococcaceae bacterium]|nr:alpha/beta hydrolase [Oscillospiraceae bacterium]
MTVQITINGIQTDFVMQGNGEPVLILPGWSATAPAYQTITKTLSEKYCVYVLNLPGFGVTPEPSEPWCVDDYVDFTLAFVQQLGLTSLTLLGHSFGGRIIIKMLSRRELPFSVEQVVLIDSAGIKPTPSPERQKKTAQYNRLKKLYGGKFFTKLCPSAMEKLRKKYGSADYAAASPMMRQCLIKTVSEDLTDLIQNVTPGALLIWGRDDTATPVSDAEKMKEKIPDSVLHIIDQAGHFPFIDQPFAFRKILADFFGIE